MWKFPSPFRLKMVMVDDAEIKSNGDDDVTADNDGDEIVMT